MNVQKIMWPVIVVLAFICGVAWQVTTAQVPSSKPKWEYKTARVHDLEKMGEDGWELVATDGRGDNFTTLYFKRAK